MDCGRARHSDLGFGGVDVKPSAEARTLPLWSHNPSGYTPAWHLQSTDASGVHGRVIRHGDGFLATLGDKELGVFRTMAAASTAVEKAMGAK